MTSEQLDTLERRAYREAGHATMSYLIRQGFVERFVPIDRSLVLPEFETVSIEGPSADWGRITFGLGSLITVPQVLLAGYLAEQLKYDPPQDSLPLGAPLVNKALHLITSYVEEYGNDRMSLAERDKQANDLLRDMCEYVTDNLRHHWASVEVVANALLREKTLTKGRVFEIVEQEIPEEAKVRAKVFITQDPQAVMLETINQMLAEQAKTTKKGKAWWEFWKR